MSTRSTIYYGGLSSDPEIHLYREGNDDSIWLAHGDMLVRICSQADFDEGVGKFYGLPIPAIRAERRAEYDRLHP